MLVGAALAVLAWIGSAYGGYGEVTVHSTGQDVPLLVGNLVALGSGAAISLGGSWAFPDTSFRWEMHCPRPGWSGRFQ